MGGLPECLLGRAVTANNENLRRRALDVDAPNPRSTDDLGWVRAVEAAHPRIRGEWDRFVDEGGVLPRIEDLIHEDQGNEGAWRAGLLVSRGRAVPALSDRFPETISVALAIPGIRSALWSQLETGAEIPQHTGPNAGVLRFHLGVDCPPGAALSVDGTTTPYRDGVAILFDDTAPHAAWNRADRPRVTLFCEVLRPAAGATRAFNRVLQRTLALDSRYRRAPKRAVAWDHALNG